MKIFPKYEYFPVDDPEARYARSEVATIAGVSEEVIAFWGKEGLLAHCEGGEGRGSHKKYDFPQVNIAIVLGALRRKFNVKTKILKDMADFLQEGTKYIQQAGIYPYNVITAARLSTNLAKFRRGEVVEVRNEEADDMSTRDYVNAPREKLYRPAADEMEVLASLTSHADFDSAQDILKASRKIPENKTLMVDRAADLFDIFLKPSGKSDTYWVVAPQDDGLKIVEFSDEYSTDLDFEDAAMFIPVKRIMARGWGERFRAAEAAGEERSQKMYEAREAIRAMKRREQ